MGTNCAPSYGNIFMVDCKRKYIYPLNKSMPMLYLRYIADIFMIWKGRHDQLQVFLKKLDKHHPTIKFDSRRRDCFSR